MDIFSLLFNSFADSIIVMNLDGKIIYVNEATERITGYQGRELLGKPFGILNTQELGDLGDQIIKKTGYHKNWKGELKQKRKDGAIYWAEFEVLPVRQADGRLIAWANILRDISERKKTEEMLLENEKKYKELFQNAYHFTYTTDLKGNFLSLNSAGMKAYGYNAEELSSLNLSQVVHPSYLEICSREYYRELAGRMKQLGPCEVLTLAKNGKKVWVEVSARLISKNGVPVGLQGIARDITKRKLMEETIKNAEKEKELILSALSEQVIFYDTEMRIKWFNRSAGEYKQKGAEELLGRYCYEIWRDTNAPCPDCPVKETLRTGNKYIEEIAKPDGSVWLIKSFPVFDGEDKIIGAVEVSKEITEAKRVEKEMARFERLNLIGEMAAGFGHEIRNPMTTVRGFLQILQSKPECLSYNNYFNLMIEEMDRANSIISEFLSLAKHKMIDLREYNLNTIIETIYPLILADAIHNDQSIELELAEIPDLLIDKKETHQLIFNLVRNGLEAMPSGGCLKIKTYIDRDEVVLAVTDQGKGIDQGIMNKLGMPFITTKENGTGLGLAVCYSIVRRHDAKMEIDSGPEGTTFAIRYKRAV
jgi:two-component system, sporulation sensor kinase E